MTFGELLLRLDAPEHSRLFQKSSLNCTFCGAEANVAASLSMFGTPSTFVTKLPNNDVGKSAKRSLDYFCIDTSKIVFGDGRMGLYYHEKGASQRPSKIIYDRKHSAFADSNPKDFDWNLILKGATWLHLTGINPALSENVCKECFEACSEAKRGNITISCDLNYRKNLWSSKTAQKTMTKLMQYADVCIANEEDAELALGIGKTESDASLGKIDCSKYESIAKEISNRFGCKYVGFTLRESRSADVNEWGGALYSSNTDRTTFSKKYEINLVDRIGGGDSFAAGLIYSLMEGKSPNDAIEFATAASCLKQTMEGDFNLSTKEEVQSLVHGSGTGRVQRRTQKQINPDYILPCLK